MPLKVSSQGWVKVPPPKKPPPRRIDPEEEKEALCSPLRYFACQGIDPTRERLRMLGGRGGFGSSQEDLYRPHSRLERHSTLDEWRFDASPPRSSSRQSGSGFESSSPPGRDSKTHRSSESDLRSKMHDGGSGGATRSSQNRRTQRISSAPVIKTISPSPSVYEDAESVVDEAVEVENYPDNASVACSETPSERACKHKHHHNRSRKAPTTILEEEEPESMSSQNPGQSTVSSCSQSCNRRHIEDDKPARTSAIPLNSGTHADISGAHKPNTDVPTPIPEHSAAFDSKAAPSRARSEISDSSSKSTRSSRSSRSSKTYRSRDEDSESSYTASVRSASPERGHSRRDHKDYDRHHYPSPPASPPPDVRRHRYDPKASEGQSRIYRDRVVTAPVLGSRSYPARSGGSWSSASSLSKSSAPSMDGYQFQAAIFQPKNYQGYRAPSLSKGNRWETATSALSFD